MATIDIECPSGMAGTVRGLRVTEANKIAGATRRKRHEMIDSVMSDCWVKTTGPGPYAFAGDKPEWDKVLQGDSQYVLMQIRIATYGPEFSFKIQCDDRQCREKFEWVLDLNEVPIQKIDADDLEQFKTENKFSAVIDGRSHSFALPTGALAKRASKLSAQNHNDKYSFALRLRLLGVEGVEANDIRKHIDAMGMGDVMELLSVFDDHDCGVDGDLEIECPECGNQMEVALPFEGDFFMPQRKKKSKQTAMA